MPQSFTYGWVILNMRGVKLDMTQSFQSDRDILRFLEKLKMTEPSRDDSVILRYLERGKYLLLIYFREWKKYVKCHSASLWRLLGLCSAISFSWRWWWMMPFYEVLVVVVDHGGCGRTQSIRCSTLPAWHFSQRVKCENNHDRVLQTSILLVPQRKSNPGQSLPSVSY
jgi:hypothetical protein